MSKKEGCRETEKSGSPKRGLAFGFKQYRRINCLKQRRVPPMNRLSNSSGETPYLRKKFITTIENLLSTFHSFCSFEFYS